MSRMNGTNGMTLTPRQAAQMRRVSLSYIYYELWADRIPGAHKVGKQWRIPREAVENKIRPASAANGR